MTRRRLAAAAAAPLLVSAPAKAAQAPGDDDLAIQRENLRRSREALRKVKLPMAVEPAFQFKA